MYVYVYIFLNMVPNIFQKTLVTILQKEQNLNNIDDVNVLEKFLDFSKVKIF